MKNKIILVLVMLLFATGTMAQENPKAAAGNLTAEIGLSLENGSLMRGGMLRFRHFMADATALRLGIGGSRVFTQINDVTHSVQTNFKVAPGVEHHFAGTEKLSPYIGIEVPLGFTTARYENSTHILTGTLDSNYSPSSGNSIGVNGVLGADYYIGSHFYMGIEMGAGYTYFNYKDVESENKSSNTSETIRKGYYQNTFTTFGTGALRFGFVF